MAGAGVQAVQADSSTVYLDRDQLRVIIPARGSVSSFQYQDRNHPSEGDQCQDVVTGTLRRLGMHVQRIHYWKLVTLLILAICLLSLIIQPSARNTVGEMTQCLLQTFHDIIET